MTADLARWAGAYQDRGWRVLPVRPGEKPPAEGGWSRDAIFTDEWLGAWESKGFNLGVQAGNSALVIVDVDGETGERSMREAKAAGIIEVPPTLTQRTPRGWHLLYEAPYDAPLKPGVDVLGGVGLHGVDVRAGVSYVVACPSVTADGGYSWVDWSVPVAPAPASVLALASGGRFRSSAGGASFDPTAGREAAVRVAVRVARKALRHGEGQHDSFYTLVSTVAAGLVQADPTADPAELMEAVASYAAWVNSRFAEPYDERELDRVTGDIVAKNRAAADVAVAFAESRYEA